LEFENKSGAGWSPACRQAGYAECWEGAGSERHPAIGGAPNNFSIPAESTSPKAKGLGGFYSSENLFSMRGLLGLTPPFFPSKSLLFNIFGHGSV